MMQFSDLCTPAKVYFGIAVIQMFFSLFSGMFLGVVLIQMLFAFIWTMVLNWICNSGYKYFSWFLVLLPYLMIMFGGMRIMPLVATNTTAATTTSTATAAKK